MPGSAPGAAAARFQPGPARGRGRRRRLDPAACPGRATARGTGQPATAVDPGCLCGARRGGGWTGSGAAGCGFARGPGNEREAEAARAVEREQEIDRWRVTCVQEEEEKKREQKLKAAADGVLSEGRKKQADTKRMVDILRALEKLRKLRKNAATRKGICPPASADETSEHHLQRLGKLIKKRSELYEAEERALRVMLEREQEEERKRELEKKKGKFYFRNVKLSPSCLGIHTRSHLLISWSLSDRITSKLSTPCQRSSRSGMIGITTWCHLVILKATSFPKLPSNAIWATAVKLH
ncbi:hypothetical protein P7K49_016227 [Saguinus oedipus]|uniref:Programmed cell death 7 n=1 Tax=Saguinus oedipus TaxID=9490 RepID=A0ABQ9VBF9_SAGOE|nr:hypothetical protein P7K49_016227 [Saguinus oedipus]